MSIGEFTFSDSGQKSEKNVLKEILHLFIVEKKLENNNLDQKELNNVSSDQLDNLIKKVLLLAEL